MTKKIEIYSPRYIKAFTLIELLVVISIIGILAALSLASFSTAQKQSRDTERKSDLAQYQNSLEGYANKNNSLYPSRPDATGATTETLCADLDLTGCPEDPKNSSDATFVYKYQSSGTISNGNPTATTYVLWAKLESATSYRVVCSNGKNGNISQASWVNPTTGVCPLP
jgi:prepilin-type N-terminal cleavage/methylation domain-containing protein